MADYTEILQIYDFPLERKLKVQQILHSFRRERGRNKKSLRGKGLRAFRNRNGTSVILAITKGKMGRRKESKKDKREKEKKKRNKRQGVESEIWLRSRGSRFANIR